MKGLPSLSADCKILIDFVSIQPQLDWTALSLVWKGGLKKKMVRGVCGPYHLWGLYRESALFYFLSSGPKVNPERRIELPLSGLWGLDATRICERARTPITYTH